MGQIVSSAAKPKRCNLNKLSQLGILAAGEHVLVSYDNSMNAAGQGNFDRYIVGDGRTAATALELRYLDDSTRPYIVEEVNKAVADIQPIEITGDVTNAPDEEDLTSENQGGTDVLKFKDKAYNSALYSGLGRVYLRKNIVTLEGTGKNVLTQAMVNAANTIYHIQYDYDLNGQTITLPAGCVLEFDGGSLSNGTLNNVGNTINALDGFKCNVGSFAEDITFIRTSDYSVTPSSEPSHNVNVLQKALDANISIFIDVDGNLDWRFGGEKDENNNSYVSTYITIENTTKAIILNSPLYIGQQAQIQGLNIMKAVLYFTDGDGFVWNQKVYSGHNYFENLTIASRGHCFNFYNNGNENRPYNVYQSKFTNLRTISLEGDCYYQGAGVRGYGNSYSFSNYFTNIWLATTRYGFNNFIGNTDFIIDGISDLFVPDTFFLNTCPNVIRKLNSSYSATKHFMVFDANWGSYLSKIYCEDCNWETYTQEVFKRTAGQWRFSLQFARCGISYNSEYYTQNGVSLYPIDLGKFDNIILDGFHLGSSMTFNEGYCLMQGDMQDGCALESNIDFYIKTSVYMYPIKKVVNDYHFGYASGKTPIPCLQENARHISLLSNGMLLNDADVINLDNVTLSPLKLHGNYTKLNATANKSVGYIAFDNSVFGTEQTNKFVPTLYYIYNDSNYTITFNTGYGTNIKSLSHDKVIMSPKDLIVVARVGDFNVCIGHVNGSTAYPKNAGTSRPSNSNPFLTQGFCFFDTSIGKPIWWNGTAWVDATGTAV